MCIFSGRVESVYSTNIFARSDSHGRQFLVYSMSLKASSEVAMVLPLPVAPGNGEDGVTFIDLTDYPDFFNRLNLGFWHDAESALVPATFAIGRAMLDVVAVGSYEASYVPTVGDFDRLDERFRVPEGTLDKVPAYRSFGFAVFKLRPGSAKFHPMAFSFPTVSPDKVFFPTVHVHDGHLHEHAYFDHMLYCQPMPGTEFSEVSWEKSSLPLTDVITESTGRTVLPSAPSFRMDMRKGKGTIIAGEHCYRRKVKGLLLNQDTTLSSVARQNQVPLFSV